MSRYQNITPRSPEAERVTFWISGDDEAGTEDLAAWLASIGSAEGEGSVGGFDTGSGLNFDDASFQSSFGDSPEDASASSLCRKVEESPGRAANVVG